MVDRTADSGEPELRRELSLLDSTMINVGSMIGSGIFLVPATVAMYLPSSPLIIIVWVVGGIVSLFGALSIAELGAIYPKAGGQFVYLREAYGPLWGFLYGWTAFTVIMCAAISAVAVGFATYLTSFIPLSETGIKAVAIASIMILTGINCFGIKLGAVIQNGLTLLKIALLAIFAVMGIFVHGTPLPDQGAQSQPGSLSGMAGAFGLALVAVLWSYDGWIEITYVAGEVRNPRTSIPRSLILSTLIVILIYILINITYLSVLPVAAITGSALVAADAAKVIFGPGGMPIAALCVIIALLGTNNGFVLTGARIYYAMAADRLFFRALAVIHPSYRTPVASLLAQGIWASLLVLTGTFNQLFTYVIFASWIFYAMTAGAVMILRKRSPELERPYKVWGYPVTPAVFILFSLYLVFNTIIEDPRDALIGTCIILAGLPAYFFWRRKSVSR